MLVQRALPALLVCLLLPALNDAEGEAWLTFVRYQNTYGHDTKKAHCDDTWVGKSSDCDFYFIFKMSGPTETRGRWSSMQTSLYRDQNTVNFGSRFNGGHVNPRGGSFKKWTNQLKYELHVWDHDTWTGNDHVDTFVHTINLPADGRLRTYHHYGFYHGYNAIFSFKAVARCSLHHYGSDCMTRCYPYDDNSNGHYTCDSSGNMICRPGWRDKHTSCKTRDFCYAQPCKNGGRCENLASTYRCDCPTNYDGTNCERRRTPCEMQNLCVNGGTCVNDGDTAKCNCTQAWKGPTCAEDRNECQEGTPCNNGTCINERGGFRCNCTFGFVGADCSQNVNECQASNRTSPACLNGGTCVDSHGSYSCICPTGFTGKKCETDKNECANPQQCLNAGNCSNTIGSFRCACPPQFQGPRCQMDVNECIGQNPCKNSGACSNTLGGYKCICPIGLHGPTCEEDEDECNSGSLTCLNGGTCKNTFGSAYCKCPATRKGSRCEKDVDECAGVNPCMNGGVCENLKNAGTGYLCNCDGTGFEGALCTDDVDECKAEKKYLCGNGTCTNTAGTYICHCQNDTHKFSLQGLQCPVSPQKNTIPPITKGSLGWIAAVVIVVLLLVLGIFAIYGWRRRDHFKGMIPARFRNNDSTSSMRYKKESETAEAEFDNHVYTPDPNDPSDVAATSGDFDNNIYAHRRTSQQTLVQNDACDSAHYAALQDVRTLPSRGAHAMGLNQNGTITVNLYGNQQGESNDAAPYDSMNGYGSNPYGGSNYGSNAYEGSNYGSNAYEGSNYGSNPYDASLKADSVLPHIKDEDELSAEEAVEDEDNYAQLPGDIYSSLSRPQSEYASEYARPRSIIEPPSCPAPPPPLPPRGGAGDSTA